MTAADELALAVMDDDGYGSAITTTPAEREQAPQTIVSRLVRLMMAFGWTPLGLSCLLLNYQALTELTEATERQART